MKSFLTLLLSVALLLPGILPAADHAPGGYVMVADSVLASVRDYLWPDMPDTVENGPEDGLYISPLENELDDLIAFYNANRFLLPYTNDAWDCDDMGREFLHLARVWGRNYYGFPAATLVGAAYVKIDGVYPLFPGNDEPIFGYHVLNVIRLANGQWLFFEPQSGMLLPIEDLICMSVTVLKIQL